MKITRRQLLRIIKETKGHTKKYDDDSALRGRQSKLPDGLQKSIIDKTVEDREEWEESERKKNESVRISSRRLRQFIREAVESEYYKDLKKRTAHAGKISGDAKDFAEIMISQIDNFISGIDSGLHPDDVKWKVYSRIAQEFRKKTNEIEKEYDKNVRQPYLESQKAKNKKSSSRNYSQIKDDFPYDDEVDDYFF